jgi:Do/DeqQ family serine protease
MKFKSFSVIATAALTSVLTLYAVSYFQPKPHFTAASTPISSRGSLTAYDDNNATAPMGAVNFESAAASAIKAVVHVKTATGARLVTDRGMGDMFSQLFGPRQYILPSQTGSGSGVVISADGYIVTNNHVVADASEVTVTFNDRYTTKAKVVATDPATDIAVLKVDGEKNIPYMDFANSDDVKIGQWVLAVGYPLNLDATVTAGIVSAKGRSLGVNKAQSLSAIESFIQTDAAVNPGNSGGALVNTAGQLIGINSAIASPTGSYAGYSYAIPANIVRKAVNDLMKYGAVQRAYMGIQYVDGSNVSQEESASLGLDKTDGVYVVSVVAGSGAAKAGIKKGDFITQINGVTVNSQPELQGQIARYQPGDNVNIVYSREGKTYNANIQLTNLNGTTDILKTESSAKLLGATFRPINDQEKRSYSIQYGLVVTNEGSGTLAQKTPIKKGFVITSINDAAISTVNDLQQALASNKELQIAGFYPGYPGIHYYSLINPAGGSE